MSKFLKGMFASTSLSQAHVLAVIGNVGTAVATFVPAWGAEDKVIVGALGGVVSNIYPLAAAAHRLIDVIESLVTSQKVTASGLQATAEQVLRAEAGKVDFNKLAQDAVSANGLTATGVESLVESKVRAILAGLGQPAPAPLVPPPS